MGQQITMSDFIHYIDLIIPIIIKGHIIFFATPGQIYNKLKPEEMTKLDKYLKSLKDLKNPNEAKEVLAEIIDDQFTEVTKGAARNLVFFKKLEKLKTNIIDYYLQSEMSLIKQHEDLKYNCDIHTTIGKMMFQLMRFRMVIQPEIQITINYHKQSEITYLTVKGFWLNDDGSKERKFQRSFGREDEYTLGKNDPKAKEEATIKMQEVLYEEYLKIYPEE